ncbi:MAG: DUF1178 family protein [Alphaproteobacteria bacterium]
MIRYALRCHAGHAFEAWFRSNADYEAQAKGGAVECPACGATEIEKQIMSPSVVRASKSATKPQPVAAAGPSGGSAEFEKLAMKLREHVETNFDYVGEKFPEEARAIHYGEKEERGIFGEASPAEVRALDEEGIRVAPLPGAKKPRARTN